MATAKATTILRTQIKTMRETSKLTMLQIVTKKRKTKESNHKMKRKIE